ncbi:hypothetical protein [Rubellimicrobium arenae]|uniref:hypothetical protein n=1 Tax=Rubellimicrobium arenae TaxID=2817372 RepID=UPI001B30BB11|nr:hypothetical protein [Rubellimicrobium arenae]
MFLTSFVASFTSVQKRRAVASTDGGHPDLDGALEELFAVWPLDPEEEREVRARYAAPR